MCGLAYNSNHVRSHILWNNDPAADFERGESVAMHQLIGTGTGDPKHCGNFCHGEHQRKFIIACVGGMLHSVLPFFTHRATNSPRTACDEFAAALLFVQPQTVDVCEKFQWPHGSA